MKWTKTRKKINISTVNVHKLLTIVSNNIFNSS